MKKTWILGLMLSLALTGCSSGSFNESETESGLPDDNAANTQISIDALEQKASYYQSLVAQLEEDVLSAKNELFTARLEYEARINELQAKLDAADEKQEDGDENSGTAEKTSNFRFSVSEGRATLVSYIGNEAEVVIPTHFEGASVVAIADRAFENKTRLSRVVLPASVETIGWFAFSGCVGLSEVVIPDSVKSISYGAFLNCNSSLTVSCSEDSYAAKYAQSYGIKLKG